VQPEENKKEFRMAEAKWQESRSSSADASPRTSGTENGADAIDYQAEIEKVRAEMARLAESVGGSLQNTMKPIARELEASVTRNPTSAVLIAAGVGLVLGVLMPKK